MTDEPPLMSLREGVLDRPALERLFADLNALASITDIRLKGHATSHSLNDQVTLEHALAALISGQIVAVQLRYQHDGRAWCDTALRDGVGFRLIRALASKPDRPPDP